MTVPTPSPRRLATQREQVLPGVVIDDNAGDVALHFDQEPGHVDERRYLTVRSSGSW